MRTDLIDWVEFVELESENPKPEKLESEDKPLIDLGEEADPKTSSAGLDSASEVDESQLVDSEKEKIEFVKLKPLQLCIVQIQNLLKVSTDKFSTHNCY